jgi:diguanylate cyclase (GGDEF)-like protein
MWIYDRETLCFLDVSEGAIHQYGYSRAEFLRMTVSDISAAQELGPVEHGSARAVGRGRLRIHRRKDGTSFPVRVSSNALLYNGRVARLVVADVASNSKEQLAHLAHYDWTTGLPNRLLLEQRVRESLKQAEKTGRRVAVICLHIENLDEVGERFGSRGADECMKQVARLLVRRVRGMDTAARTGPRLFTVGVAELDDQFDLYRVAEGLLKVCSEPVAVDEQTVLLTASVGIAVYPEDGADFSRLCHAADTAMRQARASGDHRIAMFSLETRERADLAAHMREALRLGSFQLHYQPQYSPGCGLCKFEALLRLPDKCGGFISPDLFIPIAEETGMIEQLGMWVIQQASFQARQWLEQFGSHVPIAVNVSPLQLRGPNFAATALATIRKFGIDPTIIEFEITERAVLNFEEVVGPMLLLTQAGIVFALDDFGAGYSSLQHLHRLPISVLKIDRSFIQRMGIPHGTEAIVEAIVSMAHNMGMKVIAEGVETWEQQNAAVRMGCDAIQGFLHATAVRPGDVPALAGWVMQKKIPAPQVA